jgi:hypothetical protein
MLSNSKHIVPPHNTHPAAQQAVSDSDSVQVPTDSGAGVGDAVSIKLDADVDVVLVFAVVTLVTIDELLCALQERHRGHNFRSKQTKQTLHTHTHEAVIYVT